MKYQVLFSLKNNEKLFKSVVCCSRRWRLKGYKNKLNKKIKNYLIIDLEILIFKFNTFSIKIVVFLWVERAFCDVFN